MDKLRLRKRITSFESKCMINLFDEGVLEIKSLLKTNDKRVSEIHNFELLQNYQLNFLSSVKPSLINDVRKTLQLQFHTNVEYSYLHELKKF